ELPKVHMGVALATWWWPWQAGGWGTARFDLGRVAHRMVWIDLDGSAAVRQSVAELVRVRLRHTCDLYAGLFAGAFGRLSGREVACVEVQCRSAGDRKSTRLNSSHLVISY